MSHDEEEVGEGAVFGEPLDDDELMEPLDDAFAFDDEEEQDKN